MTASAQKSSGSLEREGFCWRQASSLALCSSSSVGVGCGSRGILPKIKGNPARIQASLPKAHCKRHQLFSRARLPYFVADYKERTHITGVREMFGFVGILVASLAPQFSGGGAGSAAGFAPVMAVLGWMAIILLPLSAALMVWLVPEPNLLEQLLHHQTGLRIQRSKRFVH